MRFVLSKDYPVGAGLAGDLGIALQAIFWSQARRLKATMLIAGKAGSHKNGPLQQLG